MATQAKEATIAAAEKNDVVEIKIPVRVISKTKNGGLFVQRYSQNLFENGKATNSFFISARDEAEGRILSVSKVTGGGFHNPVNDLTEEEFKALPKAIQEKLRPSK